VKRNATLIHRKKIKIKIKIKITPLNFWVPKRAALQLQGLIFCGVTGSPKACQTIQGNKKRVCIYLYIKCGKRRGYVSD
jgi:hypothetical protein